MPAKTAFGLQQTRATHTPRLQTAGTRAFFNIAREWSLTDDQQCVLLGGVSRSTLRRLRERAQAGEQIDTLDRDKLDRLSYILGIYKALQILHPDSESAAAVIKRPNRLPGFNRHSMLARMLAGGMADLAFVREALDHQRGL